MEKPNLSEIAKIMQENMLRAQKRLAELKVTGKAGVPGEEFVEVEGNCLRQVSSVKINQGDTSIEVIQDLAKSAFNDFLQKVDKKTQEEVMADLGKGLNLPDNNELP